MHPKRKRTLLLILALVAGLGLATGFASFVAGHKGQRIILKQGLAPERVPVRDIELVQP